MRKKAPYSIYPLVLFFLALSSNLSAANSQNEIDPNKIMKWVEDRDDGTSRVSTSKLSSCRYGRKGNKLVCIEEPRVKMLEGVRKDFGKNEQEKKSLSILLYPPGERGIGFLQFDYEDAKKDSDQWMYFSALGKVKRIVSGSADEPKTGSFFGSEFSYEDMESRHIENYHHKLINQNVQYRGRDCWIVESTPKAEQAAKSNYSKSVAWIDKERLIVLKNILYGKNEKPLKRITSQKLKLVDNTWVPMSVIINNLDTKRMSILSTQKIALNVAIDDKFLTQRSLTDHSYRESNLQSYRQNLE